VVAASFPFSDCSHSTFDWIIQRQITQGKPNVKRYLHDQ
jgi:hypothetical protein